jgi:signal transduction histidine kinase
VRELLINVAKHARTEAALVESVRRDGTVVIRVADAGVGYDPASAPAGKRRGQGLVAVRERLALVGGKAEVKTAPGAGTIVVLSAPLAAGEPPALERRR